MSEMFIDLKRITSIVCIAIGASACGPILGAGLGKDIVPCHRGEGTIPVAEGTPGERNLKTLLDFNDDPDVGLTDKRNPNGIDQLDLDGEISCGKDGGKLFLNDNGERLQAVYIREHGNSADAATDHP